jgi:hypothetical protein
MPAKGRGLFVVFLFSHPSGRRAELKHRPARFERDLRHGGMGVPHHM